MHRALGGAPTLSGQWRSLGRSLLANVKAGAAWPCVWQSKAKKFSASRKRPRFKLSLHLKNKIF